MTASVPHDENAPCPCGGKKKWAKCHGRDSSITNVSLEHDPQIDLLLLALAANVLDALKTAIASVELDDEDPQKMEDTFRKRSLLYLAKKMYRITLAGITLIRVGQSLQAFTLKREQHYAWVSFQYYLANPRESILFFASGPLRQRDKAEQIMAFDSKAAADPKRQKQLHDLEAMAAFMISKFPDLRVPKGKSGSTSNPIYIDWKEPDEFTMMKAIIDTWPNEMAKTGKPIPQAEQEAWCTSQLASVQFFHAAFPSQDLHATPFGLIGDLNAEDEGAGPSEIRLRIDNPGGLLYIYLGYPLSVAEKLVEFSGARGFTDRFAKIKKALVWHQKQHDV